MLWEPRGGPFLPLACVNFFCPFGKWGVWAKGKYLEQPVHTGFSLHFRLEDPDSWSCAYLPGISALSEGAEPGFWDQMRRGEKGIPGGGQSSGQALKLYFMLSRLSQVLSVAIHLASINKE